MVAEPLALPTPAPESMLTCSPAELRLATSAVYVAEMALDPAAAEANGADRGPADRGPFVLVGESGEQPERTSDVADVAISAGLGLVRLMVPALQTDAGDAPAEGERSGGEGADGHADPEEQELVVTTRKQVHLIRILPGGSDARIIYLVFDRNRGTVVQARHFLHNHLASTVVRQLPVERAAPPRRATSGATVISLNRHPARRCTTSIRPSRDAGTRPAVRPVPDPGVDRSGPAEPALRGRVELLPRQEWASDDHTLRRVLAGLRSMP